MPCHGMFLQYIWHVMVSHDMEWHCMAWHGMVWCGCFALPSYAVFCVMLCLFGLACSIRYMVFRLEICETLSISCSGTELQ